MLTLCSNYAFAQDIIGDKAEAYYANQQYDELIELLTPNARDYSARTNYFIGLAYYALGDDDHCIEYMENTISADKHYADAHFIKGISLNYIGEFKKAVKSFESAIELDTTAAAYYSGLADAYYNLEEVDEALEAYKKATLLNDCPERPFIMIPLIHLARGDTEEALPGFYTAKSNMVIGSENYTTALYNIGLLEYRDSNYTQAEKALTELLMIDGEDFEGYIALIQVYHVQGKYNKTTTLCEQIRKAYDWEVLPESVGNQYMLEQFNLDTLSVYAYERLPQPEDELYYKIQFKVYYNDEFLYSIQLQRNIEDDDPQRKYVLGMDRNGKNSTFEQWFSEDTEYETIREAVVEFLQQLN